MKNFTTGTKCAVQNRVSLRPVKPRAIRSMIAASLLMAASHAAATNFTWTGTTNNIWDTLPTDLNWTSAWSNSATRSAPNAAIFDLASPAIVTVNSNIDTGTITFTTGGWVLAPGTGVLAFGATGTMTITTTTGSDTINAIIKDGSTFGSGGGVTSLTKSGLGTLILGAASTYTGPTAITAGTLQLGINNALPSATAFTINGGPTPDTTGTSDLHGKNQSLASIAGGAGIIPALITNNLTATTSTLTLTGSANTSFDGNLQDGSGALALSKSGSGTLTLTGQNAYTGLTTISSGGIIISSTGALMGSTISLPGNGELSVSRPVGIDHTIASVSPNSVALKGGSLSLTADLPFSAFLSNTSTGGSLLVDTAATSYTAGGTDLLNLSSLPAGSSLRLGSSSGATGTLDTFLQLIPDSTTGTLRFSAGGGTLSVNSTLADVGLTPTKLDFNGGGTTILAGNNTYTGVTTTAAGATVTVTSANSLGSPAGNTVLNAAGTLNLNAPSAEPITVAGGTLNIGANTSGPVNITSGSATVSAASSSPFALSGGNLFMNAPTGSVTIGGTAIVLLNAGGTSTITINNGGTLNFNAPSSQPITVSGGTLNVNAAASGPISASAGNVNIATGGSVAAKSITLTGANLALAIDANVVSMLSAASTAGNILINTSTFTAGGTNLVDFSTLPAGTSLRLGTSTAATFPSALQLIPDTSSHTLRFGAAGILLLNASLMDVTATPTNLDFTGVSTTILAGNSTYTGVTTINSGSSVILTSTTGLGSPTGSTIINSLGILNLNAPSAEPIALAGGTLNIGANTTGPITITSGTANANAASSSTFSISAGNLILNAPTGPVTITGTAVVTLNAGGSSPINVNGGTLNFNVPSSQPITVSGGSVNIKSAAFSPISAPSGTVSIVAGGIIATPLTLTGANLALAIDLNPAPILSAASTGGGLLINTGATPFTAGGTNLLDFSTLPGGSALRLGSSVSGSTIAASVRLIPDLASNTLRFGAGAAALNYNGVIFDIGPTPTNLDITGGSPTNLGGANTYTGTTTVQGTLNITTNTALGQGTGIDADGTIVKTGGLLTTAAGVTLANENLTLNGGTINVTTNGPVQVNSPSTLAGTFNGTISGPGDVTFNGTTTLATSGSYTGATTVFTGANVSVNAPAGLGNTPSITVAGGTINFVAGITYSGMLTFTGGTILGTETFANSVQVGSDAPKVLAGTTTMLNGMSGSGTITVGQSFLAGTVTIDGPIANPITFAPIYGTLNLNNSGHLTGPMTITNGTVNFNAGTSIDSVTISADAGRSGTANFNVPATLNTLNVPNGVANFAADATINAFTINQGAANFAGPTTLNQASLQGGNVAFNGPVTFNGPLRITGSNVTLNGPVAAPGGNVTVTLGTLTLNSSNTFDLIQSAGNSAAININANTTASHFIVDGGTTTVKSGDTLALLNSPLILRSGGFSGSIGALTNIEKIGIGVAGVTNLGAAYAGSVFVDSGAMGVDVSPPSTVYVTSPFGASIIVGNPSNSIFLNNAIGAGNGYRTLSFSGTFSGSLDLGSAGSTIDAVGEVQQTPFITGTISGGSLTLGTNTRSLFYATSSSTYTGQTILHGMLQLVAGGRLASTSEIVLGDHGELQILDAANLDQVADNIPITGDGGTISLIGGSLAKTETLGAFTANYGASIINVVAGLSVTMNLTSLNRNPGATLNFQNNPLGGTTPDPNSKVFFSNAPSLHNGVIGGWAVASTYSSNTVPPDFATYGPNGAVALGSYQTNINAALAGDNVNVTSAATLTSGKTINSLRVIGTTLDLGGNTLAIDSGGIIAFPPTPNGTLSTIQNGTLTATATSNGELILHAFNAKIAANITDRAGGPTQLTLDGAVILSGTNTYTGITYIGGTSITGGGSLQFNSLAAVPHGDFVLGYGVLYFNISVTGTIVLGNITANALALSGDAQIGGTFNNLTVNAASYTLQDLDLHAPLSGAGPMTIYGPVTVWGQSGGNLSAYQGNITVNNYGVLTGTNITTLGAGTVTINPGGRLVVNSASTSGNVILNGGTLASTDDGVALAPGYTFTGTVQVAADSTISNIILSNTLTVNENVTATLDTVTASSVALSGTIQIKWNNISIGALTGTGNVTNGSFPGLSSTLTVTGTSEFDGILQDGAGKLALTKSIGGVFTLTGANTYSGGTTISGGTLLASNTTGSAAGTGPVTLNGGTLGGYGTISGPVLAGSGAHTIAPSTTLPATSTGTLTLGALTTNANTTLAFNLITPGTASVNDALNITTNNGLTLSGGKIQVANTSTGPASLGYYKILEYAGAIQGTGPASLILPALQNDIAYTLDTTHDAGFIDLHKGFLGDANDDGLVNFSDFVQLSNHFGQSSAGWTGGDFNNDGITNFADFVTLSNNFGQTIGAAEVGTPAVASGVPEPASLVLLGAGFLCLFGSRRMEAGPAFAGIIRRASSL